MHSHSRRRRKRSEQGEGSTFLDTKLQRARSVPPAVPADLLERNPCKVLEGGAARSQASKRDSCTFRERNTEELNEDAGEPQKLCPRAREQRRVSMLVPN